MRKRNDKYRYIRGGIESETFDAYTALKGQEGWRDTLSDNQAIHALVAAYTKPSVTLQPHDAMVLLGYGDADITTLPYAEQVQRCKERDDILKARQLPHIDFWQMVRSGLVREARTQNTQAEKLATADFSELTHNGALGQMRKNRLRGSSEVQIDRFVTAMMQANVTATNPMHIIYVTRGIVRDATKINTTVISKWFEAHATELQAHHAALGIHSEQAGIAHNRKRKRYWAEHPCDGRQEETPLTTNVQEMDEGNVAVGK